MRVPGPGEEETATLTVKLLGPAHLEYLDELVVIVRDDQERHSLAREVGGCDLGRLLRSQSAFLREDARTRAEMQARQSWTDGTVTRAGVEAASARLRTNLADAEAALADAGRVSVLGPRVRRAG